MKTFLQHVADDLFRKLGGDLSATTVVFANKRASLYFDEYLLDIAGKPLFSPRYQTIEELFSSKSRFSLAGKIEAVSTLYNVYQRFIPSPETIDRFWGWGEILLADFDDIDKHLANARLVLGNAGDLHAYDNIDYIDGERRELLKRFFAEFSDEHNTRLKRRFAQMWNRLYDIYAAFNDELRAKNVAYEGAIFRDVAARAEAIDWSSDNYVFVGFNMLWEAEQQLFDTLQKKGLARFYWDFDSYYTAASTQEAGRFVRLWLKKYPNELPIDSGVYDNFSKAKNVCFVSAATEDIQARYAAEWLGENGRSDGNTAIVLADERLLGSVARYLPQGVSGKTNITVGLPLSETPARSLAANFLRLHAFGYNAAERSFLASNVRALLTHPLLALLIPELPDIIKDLLDCHSFTFAADDLCVDEILTLIFKPVDEDYAGADLLSRLLEILRRTGIATEKNRLENEAESAANDISYDEQLTQESIFRMHGIVARVADVCSEMPLSPVTLLRLIEQIAGSATMPLRGEPVSPLQITGVLETRNLDFDHLLILSCNEGNIPKGVNSTTMLPYVVRHAHGLTTPEVKTAVQAFYFYRLLQRCGDITIAYNSATDEGKTGQMSRFMLQLTAETDPKVFHLTHLALRAEQSPVRGRKSGIEKSGAVLAGLNKITSLSPSAINTYMRCPMRFYFEKIAGIREPDSEDIADNRMFGTILHAVAEDLYGSIIDSNRLLAPEAVDAVLDEKGHARIRRAIDNVIARELFNGRSARYDGLQLINREVIAHYITTVLRADRDLAPLHIEGLERPVYGTFDIIVNGTRRQIEIGGIIDRLDRIDIGGGEVLRVVDYKTGGGTQETLGSVDDVFNSANIEKKHSDYYLQAMLYATLVRRSDKPFEHRSISYEPLNPRALPVRPALLFIQKKASVDDPVLKFGGKNDARPIDDIADCEPAFSQQLVQVVAEIFDPAAPFAPTSIDKFCNSCPFRALCKGYS
ncbi:MAG: PD-(D/E)XK nuclease family protein [Prevotella sp.]|nr:PD-(D/E)XK nuclease family protein [Prevotella sp.]